MENDFLRTMGRRILDRRKVLKLTQDRLAELAELTPQTISTAERGVKALRPENIVKICNALQITPNDLLLGDEPPEPEGRRNRYHELSLTQRTHLQKIIEHYIDGITENDSRG